MICDFHVRISDDTWPQVKIIISREGKPSVVHQHDYDKAATQFEPAVNNVVRQEIDRIVERRLKR